MKTAMIIVGTTNFDRLIETLDTEELYNVFKSNGFTKIIFQIGSGAYVPKNFETYSMEGEIYQYKPDYEEDIKKADFLISHAGAGTILDCLKMKKPLLCVINNSLMNNHQSELLNQLKKEKFIFGIEGPEFLKSQLDGILKSYKENYLQEYPSIEKNKIQTIINDLYM